MNKRLVAAAVAGLFAAPAALAQTSNVEIYGRLVLGVDQYEAKGSANSANDFDSRLRVFDNTSRVGLRGKEDLGGGVSAIFQIETGVNVDSGGNLGQGGQVNGSSGFWASRDSFVGLDSAIGRVTLGRQTIYRLNGPTAQFAGLYINAEVPWTDGTNLGRVTTSAVGATVPGRTSNVVMYTTPTAGGINASLSYAPGAEAVQGQGVAGGTDTDGRIFAAEARGTWGPVYASLHYADVEGNTVNATGFQPKLKGYRGGLSWGYMPGARVGAIYTRAESNGALGVTQGNKVDADAWVLNWEHTLGNVQLMAQYGQLQRLKGCNISSQCDDTEAKAWLVGARYLMSRRTWLFASYNEVDNDANQFSDYTGGAQTSVAGAPPLGADPRIIAVGIFHQF